VDNYSPSQKDQRYRRGDRRHKNIMEGNAKKVSGAKTAKKSLKRLRAAIRSFGGGKRGNYAREGNYVRLHAGQKKKMLRGKKKKKKKKKKN